MSDDDHTEDNGGDRSRLETMLESARNHDPTDASFDADATFEAIVDGIEGGKRDDAGGSDEHRPEESPSGAETSNGPADDGPANDADGERRTRRWRSLALAAAAVALAAGAALLYRSLQPTTDGPSAPGTGPVAESDPDRSRGAEPPPQDPGPRWDELRAASTRLDGLHVFATPDAEWTLSGDSEVHLQLESGGVLVEFLPQNSRSLRLTAPGYTLHVVGTVFYASASEDSTHEGPTSERATPPRAGVLAGRVKVTPTPGDDARDDAEPAPIALEAGRELDAEFKTRRLSPLLRRAADARIDLEGHRRKIEAIETPESPDPSSSPERAAAETPAAPSAENGAGPFQRTRPDAPSTKRAAKNRNPDPSDVQTLRARADRAAGAGRVQDALRYYEMVLKRLPDDDATAGAVHLDIANLYLRKLDAPERALPHLRTFLNRWPDDVAAASVRREFCRVIRKLDRRDARCSNGNAP